MKVIKLKKKAKEFKLDLGTGKGEKKPAGFIGVDIIKHKGVDQVVDLRKKWPWKNESVDEVNCSYLLQYFNSDERRHFMNELHRVLKPEAKAVIVVPSWSCTRAYVDARVQFPPVSEAWFCSLNKEWRDGQNCVDDSGYKCDFTPTIGYGLHPAIVSRTQEYQQHAVSFFKEAAQDVYATLVKKS